MPGDLTFALVLHAVRPSADVLQYPIISLRSTTSCAQHNRSSSFLKIISQLSSSMSITSRTFHTDSGWVSLRLFKEFSEDPSTPDSSSYYYTQYDVKYLQLAYLPLHLLVESTWFRIERSLFAESPIWIHRLWHTHSVHTTIILVHVSKSF